MLGYSSQTLLSSDSEDSEEGLQNLELDETAEMPEKVVLRARKEDKPEIERHTGPTELQKLSKKLSLIDEIPPGPAWDSKKEFLAVEESRPALDHLVNQMYPVSVRNSSERRERLLITERGSAPYNNVFAPPSATLTPSLGHQAPPEYV